MKNDKIVAVRRDSQGRLVEFKTNSGKVYDYEMAVEAIKNNELTNAELIKNKAGSKNFRLYSVQLYILCPKTDAAEFISSS